MTRVEAVLGTPQSGSRLRRSASLHAPIFVLALACRLGVIFRDGGLHGTYGYDGPVYFTAADAFVHGRLPYRDFVLLHPPALMLALSPFAALTRLTTDETAFTIANLAFAVLGAVNAVLVVGVCRALGLSRRAAAAGGLFYAVWFGAVGAEYLTKLEPLGNAVFLSALLLGCRQHRTRAGAAMFGAGLCLGVAMSVKIWWTVPVVVVLIWFARTRGRRAALHLLAGAGCATAVIDLPFFLAAPRQMWSAVITQQVGRQSGGSARLARLSWLSTAPRLSADLPVLVVAALALVFLVILCGVVRDAWHVARCRPVVTLLLIQLVVLLAAPSFFDHYTDYPAAALSVTVAAAVHHRVPAGDGRRIGTAGWAATGFAAVMTAVILGTDASAVRPYAGAPALARAVTGVGCVMSDSPMTLIELDVLSRDLARGCPNWVDVTGRTYGIDRLPGAPVRRSRNLRWQRDLVRYLRSGQAVIIGRSSGTGISRATQAAIDRDGVLARAGGHVVYRVRTARTP